MAKHIPVGIDLGTSRSLIAYIDGIGRPRVIEDLDDMKKLTPSIIMFDKEGDDMVISVGEVAKRAAVARPGDVIRFVKSHMHDKEWKWTDQSGKEWTPSTLSSLILKKMKAYAERTLRDNQELPDDQSITHAVITVPYYFGDLERERTKEAGKIAGFEVMSIIDEPVAAAIAFGLNDERVGLTSLIYDLGGGTFDIAVTNVDDEGKIKVIATHGHRSLGGANFDQIICDYFKEEFQKVHGIDPLQDLRTYQDFMEKAEASKEALSVKNRKEVSVPLTSGGKILDLTFTREKLEELIHPLLDVTINLLEETLVNLKVSREITPDCKEYTDAFSSLKTQKDIAGEKIIKQEETDLLEKLRENKRKELNGIRIEAETNPSQKSNWEKIKTEEWEKIDRILLVGGSTKIPKVQEMLTENSGKIPQTLASPDEAVALGAAIFSLWEYAKIFPEAALPVVMGRRPVREQKIVKIVSHSLGVKALSYEGDKFLNSKIIYKGAERPAEGQGLFTNAVAGATSIQIQLLQGESEEAEYCQPVGDGCILRGIPPMAAHTAKIKVILKYDEEDMIHVTAIEEISGETLQYEARVQPIDIEKEKMEIDQMVVR